MFFPCWHLQVQAEFIHGLAFLELFFIAWIAVWLPEICESMNGVDARKYCGQRVRVVEITTNHFDTAG